MSEQFPAVKHIPLNYMPHRLIILHITLTNDIAYNINQSCYLAHRPTIAAADDMLVYLYDAY